MSQTINFQKQDGVAHITLNRPEVYNSFNREMALQLIAVLQQCREDDAIRAIVLTGSGKAFCAGQDLKEVTDPKANPGFLKILEEHYNPIIKNIREIRKPIVAAVNGVAAGAGANIALACDVVIATEKASFIQAFSAIGLIPDSGGTYFLPRLVGFQKALALTLLGDKISAVDAEKMGMIYKVVPEEAFVTTVDALSKKLAKMPTKALGLIKEAFEQSLENNLNQQLAAESKLQIAASQTEDYQEGVNAFVEKRSPNFKGR